jgi:acylphosphatase
LGNPERPKAFLDWRSVATKRVLVRVSGDVQGVGFRWYCREEAMGAGVGGFVRNLPDGRVEAAFEGDSEAVDAMVAWCRTGPAWASVTSVEVEEEDPLGERGFSISR